MLLPRNLTNNIWKRWSSAHQFSVIRMPVATARKLERESLRRKRKDQKELVKQSWSGDHNVAIISCKRKEYNHYHGQTYNKFEEIPLASKGWKHLKSAGDFFTISGCKGNPSVEDLEDGQNFECLGLEKDLLSEITKLGFERPTNIQTLAIPHVLEGKNTLITAETGNGKTLAFLAPMLQQINHWKRALGPTLPLNSPLGLVIVTSRELAQQIHGIASRMGEHLGINVDLILGGKIKRKMLQPKMSETHLAVATIGALSKLTTTRVYRTNYLRHVTLDEVDSLLDDSFSEQVVRYISKLPMQGGSEGEPDLAVMSGVQMTLVAATLPRSLNTILHPFLDMESLVHISTPHLNRLMPHVPQHFIKVNGRTKPFKLLELVKKDSHKKTPVVIFSNQSKTCDWVSLFLNENGVSCLNLNGAMSAKLREGRFEAFQSGKVLALSCTDLTSRGLDTVQAGHVVNYDFPRFVADYIHRCGRTGRVGSHVPGVVTSLVRRNHEVDLLQKIESAVRKDEAFHNVNANIKKIINRSFQKEEERLLKMEGDI